MAGRFGRLTLGSPHDAISMMFQLQPWPQPAGQRQETLQRIGGSSALYKSPQHRSGDQTFPAKVSNLFVPLWQLLQVSKSHQGSTLDRAADGQVAFGEPVDFATLHTDWPGLIRCVRSCMVLISSRSGTCFNVHGQLRTCSTRLVCPEQSLPENSCKIQLWSVLCLMRAAVSMGGERRGPSRCLGQACCLVVWNW